MRGVTGLEQVLAAVGAHRPVVVLAAAVDPGEGLLVQQADEPVAAGNVLHDLHRQLLVVGADVRVLEHRGELVLVGRDLVVPGLDRDSELGQLALGLEHVGEDPLRDRAEVVIVELVPLGRLGAEQGAAGGDQVRPLEVVLLVDQEVLLLGPDGGEDPLGLVVAEQLQRPHRRLRQCVHRAQQRDLVIERLTGPRRERRGNAEQGPVGVLEDERRAGRIPGGVAAGLERGADPSGGKARGVRLALDQLLAGEFGQRGSLAGGAVERVVLLGGHPGQRLEPVGVVGGAVLQRPLLHRQRDRVGGRGVERFPAGQRLLEAAEDVLGEPLALDRGAEDVGAEHLVVLDGQIRGAKRGTVGRPLGCEDVLLANARHAFVVPSFESADGGGGAYRARPPGRREAQNVGDPRATVFIPMSKFAPLPDWPPRSSEILPAMPSYDELGRSTFVAGPERYEPDALPAGRALRASATGDLARPVAELRRRLPDCQQPRRPAPRL